MDRIPGGKPVVLFDGWCGLCGAFAGWLLRHDRKEKLLLATLQGETAPKLLAGLGYGAPPADSIILLENGGLYLRSTAVLRILRQLGPPWSIFYALVIIPRPLRDLLYRLIAGVRYRVFGRRGSCRTPQAEDYGRMLP